MEQLSIMTAKIRWCFKQKNGIRIVEINRNLYDSYMKDAEDSLKVMLGLEGKWKVITAYYACYNALYALLMNAGVESEIHECTIALMEIFHFSKEQILFMSQLKKQRIDVQYYLQMPMPVDETKIKQFIADCKSKSTLEADKIELIKDTLRGAK